MHHLIQEDILSVSDEEKILSHDTRKNQAREMVLKLRRCSSSQFLTFMTHLQSEHLDQDWHTSVDDDTGESVSLEHCIMCDVIKIVEVDDIIDNVYQRGLLDSASFEIIWKAETNKDKWHSLLDKLPNNYEGIQTLVALLSKKYATLSQRLASSQQSSFECNCCSTV